MPALRATLAAAALLLAPALAQTPSPAADTGPAAVAVAQRPNASFPVATDTAVRGTPTDGGPVLAHLRYGLSVLVTGILPGGAWLQVLLPDGTTTGYVPAAAIPAALGSSIPASLSGPAIVRDTATLVVQGYVVRLAGLAGTGGKLADDLQHYVSGKGGVVTCMQQSPGQFRCTLAGGTDLALVALVNGAALAAKGAPEEYRRQQDAARRAQRGIWAPPPA